eukprot:749003-Hanusia_phi.AAC.1
MPGFTHVNVGELVKTKSLHAGKHEDEDFDNLICDELEDQMAKGGNVHNPWKLSLTDSNSDIQDWRKEDIAPRRFQDLRNLLRKHENRTRRKSFGCYKVTLLKTWKQM